MKFFDIYGVLLNFECLSNVEKLYVILMWLVLSGGSCYYWGFDIDVYDKVVVF